MQGQMFRLDDFARHVAQLELYQLLLRDGLSELNARLCVVESARKTGLGRADRPPGDAEASLIQTRQRRSQALSTHQHVVRRDAALVQDDFSGFTRPKTHLAVRARRVKSAHRAFDDETADRFSL